MKNLLLLFVCMLQSCLGFSQDIKGTWSGNLDFGVQKLKFVLHIDHKDGQWSALADSPDQGARDIPFDITIKNDSIFLSQASGIQVRLMYNQDDILAGDFTQNWKTIPLKLSRIDKGELQASSRKMQTPEPPYPYDTLEVSIPQKFQTLSLSGTLSKPRGNGSYPAVILVSGSGPQDRDSDLFGHKLFKVLADYLTRQGIIVLRYDDRGVGKSEGDYARATIEDFGKDAISAFEFLKTVKNVDLNKLGIIGHSEGGLIANLLAGQGVPNLSFIVSLAGPSIPIDELMVEQLYHVGKSQGMSEFQLAMAKEINKKNFAVVKSNLPREQAYNQLKKNLNILHDSDRNKSIREELVMMLTPAYRYFLRIEPAEFIKKIYIPVFGAFGTLDVQVPSTINLRGYYDNLPKNSKTVLKEYLDLNHLFQKAKTGKLDEYASLHETMNPQLMQDIASWIKGL